MAFSGLPAPLAAALADRGYDSPTPVQEAILAEGTAGRDLLVSAQTGSGKTLAFALAFAADILGDEVYTSAAPRALVVAPTRELALQVCQEIEWLYAQTGARVASCVGGMDFRTERRALERGATIVVGTPGRLRDHIERGSLDLAELRAAVLDEADEMLDLGFREDLEFILGAAPVERRTLLFSATVPAEIEALARTFQRDALRVAAMGEARQHGDIAYRALSVATRDKEAAIFNLLRAMDPRLAIVFCKTRAAVTHLVARMANRGFAPVALSGELSQNERSHALQALRDGRAKVCIATDVAARGLDLPGLDLVVHFDLPTNPDTLKHRSGRTGRAGAKGTSALIVTPADFRKAQRVLKAAQVNAEWGAPPSAEEVQAADDARLLEHAMFRPAVEEEEATGVAALLDAHGAEGVALGLLRLWRAGRSAPEVLGEVATAPTESGPRRERGEFGPSVWFALSVGHEGRAEARWLLPKICEAGGIAKDGIGAIRVTRDETYVQIADAVAGRFVPAGQSLELEPGLNMRRIEGEPVLDRPMRAGPRPDRKPGPRDRDGDRSGPPREARPARPPRPVAEEDRPRRSTYDPDRSTGSYREVGRAEDADRPPRKPYAPRSDGDSRAPDSGRRPYGGGSAAARPESRGQGDAPRKPRSTGSKSVHDGDAPRSRPAAAGAGGYRAAGPAGERGGYSERPPRAGGPKPEGAASRRPAGAERAGPGPKGAPSSDKRPFRAPGGKPGTAPRSRDGADHKPATKPAAAPRPNMSDPSQSLRSKPRTTGPGKPPRSGGPAGRPGGSAPPRGKGPRKG